MTLVMDGIEGTRKETLEDSLAGKAKREQCRSKGRLLSKILSGLRRQS